MPRAGTSAPSRIALGSISAQDGAAIIENFQQCRNVNYDYKHDQQENSKRPDIFTSDIFNPSEIIKIIFHFLFSGANQRIDLLYHTRREYRRCGLAARN
jgi:hypothetical protein